MAGLLTKLGKNHASNPAHWRMSRGKNDLRRKKRPTHACVCALCGSDLGQPAPARSQRQKHGRRKKEKNMSATGIEPMTNHLGDRNVTIVLVGC
jgi:hypothetical protein